jgi:photosystem II stability/assembly factor-like uncharacterized protein
MEPGSGGAITALSVSPHDPKRLLAAGDMLGVGLSTDGGDSWQSTTGFRSWEIADFTWHPADAKTVWVGTMSGPYVSRDGGKTWEERRTGFPPVAGGQYSAPVQKVLFDPADPSHKHLLAFGGSSRFWESPGKPLWGAVWESRDAGTTWSRLTTVTKEGSSAAPDAEGANVTAVAYAPGAAGKAGRLYALAAGAGFLVSGDNGKTWQKRMSGLPAGAGMVRFAVHPADPDTVWVATGSYKATPDAKERTPGGVFKTTDGGRTWRDSSAGLGRQVSGLDGNQTSHYDGIAVAPSDPRVLYTNDGAWSTGVVYKSEDGGATWKPVASKRNVGRDSGDAGKAAAHQVSTAYPAGLSLATFAVDPKDPKVAYGFNSEFIVRTRDGGRTWDDATAVRAAGDAWRGRGYSGLCSINVRFNPAQKGDAVLLAMDAGKLWRSTDDLKTWTFHGQDPWPWGGGNDAAFAGPYLYATCGQFGQFLGIRRTTDGGKTWTTLGGAARGLPELNAQGAQPAGIYARPDYPKDVWACIAGRLYHSGDAGERWAAVEPAPGPGLGWFAADPKDPSRFWVSGEQGVYETRDGGATFAPVGGPKKAGRLAVAPDGSALYAVSWRSDAANGGLWRRDPSGNWTCLIADPYVANVAVDPRAPRRLAACTSDDPYHDVSNATGVWVSADGGATWRQANEGLAMLRGLAIAFDPHTPGRLVFGTMGRGYFVTDWPAGYVPPGPTKDPKNKDGSGVSVTAPAR